MLDQLTLYQKHYDLILYAFPIILKYPRDTRFTLGQQTIDCLIEIARMIAVANKQRERRKTLFDIDLQLEELRLLIRLAKDLKLLPLRQYGLMSERINEVGRLLGGWMKSNVPDSFLPNLAWTSWVIVFGKPTAYYAREA